MGKKSSSPPPAPDPRETAAAEFQYNNLNTYGPSGEGIRYGYTDPATGEFVMGQAPEGAQAAQTIIESPTEAAIRQALEPASLQLVDRIISDNVTNMPDAARVQDRGTVAQSIFDRAFSMMAPGIETANSRLIQNLQNRGIPVGAEAFNDAYGNQLRETQDTIARLAMDADVAAGQEQSRQFGLDQAQRSAAISEIVAAMGGGYNPPSGAPSGASTPINYSGLVSDQYNAQMEQWQAQQQSNMAAASTIGSIGSALMKCTEAAKDIHGAASTHRALGAVMAMQVKGWSYKPDMAPPGDNGMKHIGPMAEDFQHLTGLGDGKTISVIDYLGLLHSALQEAMLRIIALERQVSGETVQ